MKNRPVKKRPRSWHKEPGPKSGSRLKPNAKREVPPWLVAFVVGGLAFFAYAVWSTTERTHLRSEKAYIDAVTRKIDRMPADSS